MLLVSALWPTLTAIVVFTGRLRQLLPCRYQLSFPHLGVPRPPPPPYPHRHPPQIQRLWSSHTGQQLDAPAGFEPPGRSRC
eukprot:2603712-Rhodomonas_salina.1